jgi:hypothetical protein
MRISNDFFSSGFEKIEGAVASLAESSRSLVSKAGENIKIVRMAQFSLATLALSVASPAVVGEHFVLSATGGFVSNEASTTRARLKAMPSDADFAEALRQRLGSEADALLKQAVQSLAPKVEKRDQKKRLDELATWRAS